MRTVISELQPGSRAQFASFGNIATQDAIRASTWEFEARGVPLGCLLPTAASKTSGVPFARVRRLRSLTCSTCSSLMYDKRKQRSPCCSAGHKQVKVPTAMR